MTTTTPTSDPAATAPRLPDALRLGPTDLVVRELGRSIAFYEQVIGLEVFERNGETATLGAPGGEPLLTLHEDRNAAQPGRHAGLYHVALLFPTREELAHVAQRIVGTQTPIQGASDHETHEAIYLPDPDGNGLELAADRPRDEWPPFERVYDMSNGGGPKPLDVADLMAGVQGQPAPARAEPGLRTGHLHLHVGDLDEGLAFYRDVLGFDLIANLGGVAAFVSAGGYHHHLGFNTWRGVGVPPAPLEGVVGMDRWNVQLPTAEDVAAVRERLTAADVHTDDRPGGFLVRDPWNNALLITTTDEGENR